MGITIEGFGRSITSDQLDVGQLAILGIRPHTGIRQLLVMRISEQNYVQDLVLGLLSGPGLPKDLPHYREIVREGSYVTLPGSFVARPIGLPIPNDEAGGGALVIDDEGEAFVRVQDQGVTYVHLATGKAGRPGINRAYFPDWVIILQLAGREQVAARFTHHIIADMAALNMEPANAGIV